MSGTCPTRNLPGGSHDSATAGRRACESDAEAYVAYAYSYPHKSAYGPLDPLVCLAPLWQAERRDALFLYFHIPFCEMRCGFCNLFARAGGEDAYLEAYLDALERQADALADATTGNRQIVRLAVGGGTPTFLSPPQFQRLFDIAERYFSASGHRIPVSVETSPKTATVDRLTCLKEHGVDRISIGIQSFSDADNRSIGRPQSSREVHTALEQVRSFPTLNIDLIYGQPGQTVARWLESLNLAMRYEPEELYLYPLYVRPRTGIGRRGDVQRASSAHMRHLYRAGRDLLEDAGYEQISMRYFRRQNQHTATGPVYCCQTDGMIGLGCGSLLYLDTSLFKPFRRGGRRRACHYRSMDVEDTRRNSICALGMLAFGGRPPPPFPPSVAAQHARIERSGIRQAF